VNALDDITQIFNQYRVLLFSIAYRLLGSATDAEDIVQEAFLRWLQATDDEVRSPRAYLSTVVVRLCLDQLRSARAQREVYVGPCLPEPVLTNQSNEPDETSIMAESLSFAFLVMLEKLGPLERAIFLLREVFDYDYPEIAAIVGKSEANCRQILHRAHQHLGRRPRFDVSREQQNRIVSQFLRASTSGDMDGLLHLLKDDIVYTGDGGGKVSAGLRPVQGAGKAARGMLGGLRWIPAGARARIEEVNGQPAIVIYLDDGRPYGVALFDIAGEQIQSVYFVVNPDKLHWLNRGKTFVK
jgi:RNA polymerase sigma-70 factor (ECF subfamily)